MNRRNSRFALVISGLAIVATMALSGCSSAATSSAQCGLVIGDGKNSHNADFHKLVLPGTTEDYDLSAEVVRYVPCGPRNFLITDGTKKGLDGKVVGDRASVAQAMTKKEITKPSVQVDVSMSLYWTLNQEKPAMINFYNLCYKYTCYTENMDEAGSQNSSTPGWNSMLAENMSPAADRTLRTVMPNFTTDIINDQASWKTLGDQMSAEFMKQIRTTTGYTTDLFCGSGNSTWNKAKTVFTCSNVRIVIDDITESDASLRQNRTDAAKIQNDSALNDARVAAAKKLYGTRTDETLSDLDKIKACKAAGATCLVNIGSGGSPIVTVPQK